MSSQIYYVSSLNQEDSNDASGNFTGAVTAQPTTNGVNFTQELSTNGSISVTDFAQFFQILTTAAAGNEANATDLVTGVAKVAQASLPSGGNGFVDPASFSSGRATYAGILAQAVFGNAQTTDFFSNLDTVMDGYETAMATMTASLNTSVNASCSEELYNAMILNHPQRFGLAYNATVSGSSAGTYSSVTATGNVSGATCVVEVEIGSSDDVLRITRTAAASGTFTTSDVITIANGGGTGVNVSTSKAINSIQVAILNNTLTNATSLPIEAGDTLRVVFEVQHNAGQQAADGDDIADDALPCTGFVDFVSA